MKSSQGSLLQILPLDESVKALYCNHGTFHDGDSGLDLFVCESATVKAGETKFLRLGIKAAAYDQNSVNVSFLILPRSSIAKTPLRVSNSLGLIDAGFRGELRVAVDNIKSEDYRVEAGDRLVQAVFFDGQPFSFKLVDSLTETSRGAGGWGSTSQNKVAGSVAAVLYNPPPAAVNVNNTTTVTEC